jgi:hypothetical protein
MPDHDLPDHDLRARPEHPTPVPPDRSPGAAMVAALWRAAPPGAADADHPHMLRTLTAHLERVAESARRQAGSTAHDDAHGMLLLADTADVLRAALADPHTDRWQPPPVPELPWPARLRLARLEHWLVARAPLEPGAMAAADLCLWLAEHLEAAQR